MNAHTITPAQIRRFPFAVNPSRISDQDEAYIAAHMAASVKAEQRANGFRPGAGPAKAEITPVDWARANAIKKNARKDAVMRMLANGGMSTREICAAMSVDKHFYSFSATREFLGVLQDEGMLTSEVVKCGNARRSVWNLVEAVK